MASEIAVESDSSQPFCRTCAAHAPTKYVEFYQNIGMLVTRQWARIDGNLCRRCIRAYFCSYTLTTLFLGWWGLISFFVTPFVLLNNIIRYLASLSLPEPGIAAMDMPPARPDPIQVSTCSRKFKFIYGAIIAVVILSVVASQSLQFMEKHAPSVNAAVHSGEISNDADAGYAGMKIGDDINVLAAPIKGEDWTAMRAELLSRQRYLTDLKLRNEKLGDADLTLTIKDDCDRIALKELLPALNQYAKALDGEFAVFKSAPSPTPDAAASLTKWSKQEDAARQRLSSYFAESKAKGCDK